MTSTHDRYLRLLGVAATPPSLDLLRQLTARHVWRVPFENVSKLLLYGRERCGRPVTIDEFLDGIEHRDLGGTCYSSNPFFADLLAALGFDAHLVGADMQNPDVHTAIRVRIAAATYHVDVGYGGPFTEPVDVAALPHEIVHGACRYVFRPEGPDALSLAVMYGGERVHGYVAHGPARMAGYFDATVIDSFAPGRTFMACLRIVRYFETHSVELKNRTMLVCRGDRVRRTILESREALRRVLDQSFKMPRCPVERALDVLEELTGRPFESLDAEPQL